jgi:hypothetical protein
VLDLYRGKPGALEDDQLRDAMASADTAALMMLGLRTEPDQAVPVGSIMPSRRVPRFIRPPGWCQYNSMSVPRRRWRQLDVGAPEALARMRAHAYAHNRLLIDVARDVVGRRLVFTEGME